MKFIDNIFENMTSYIVLTDELGNEVWSSSSFSSTLKRKKKNKDGLIQYEDKYYEVNITSYIFSAQKYYLIEYIDVTKYILREKELCTNENKTFTYESGQK